MDGGNNWVSQACNTDKLLSSVWFADIEKGWIAGEEGTILNTHNGGNEWNQQLSGTTEDLNSICFIDSLNGWIVGDNGIILKTNNGGIVGLNKIHRKQN